MNVIFSSFWQIEPYNENCINQLVHSCVNQQHAHVILCSIMCEGWHLLFENISESAKYVLTFIWKDYFFPFGCYIPFRVMWGMQGPNPTASGWMQGTTLLFIGPNMSIWGFSTLLKGSAGVAPPPSHALYSLWHKPWILLFSFSQSPTAWATTALQSAKSVLTFLWRKQCP